MASHTLDDPRVRAAMRAVPRSAFLPAGQEPFADEDRALPIGHGSTCSQPTTVLHVLSLLDVGVGARVLDVGSGSGWTTALLAHLVGQTGSVRGVELVPELVAMGQQHLAGLDLPWASIEAAAPGVLGLPDGAPYDRVLVSAEAGELPQALVDQLAEDGRMVAPVAGRLLVVRRRPGAEPAVEPVGHYRFVPLR